MTVTTRCLAAADWPQLWPLLQGMGTTETESATHRRFLELLDDPRWAMLGAEIAGQVVGYAAMQDYGPHLRAGDAHRVARLHDVYVRHDRRRQGVGRALMDAVAAWAAEHVRHLEWQAHHERAAPFYERLGFRGEPCPQPEYPTFLVDFRAD